MTPDVRQIRTGKEEQTGVVGHNPIEAHESLHTRGRDRAKVALTALTDRLAASPLPELQTFRRTLMRWRREILTYFATGLTNARTEGFNNKAKLVKSALTAIGASGTTDSDA